MLSLFHELITNAVRAQTHTITLWEYFFIFMYIWRGIGSFIYKDSYSIYILSQIFVLIQRHYSFFPYGVLNKKILGVANLIHLFSSQVLIGCSRRTQSCLVTNWLYEIDDVILCVLFSYCWLQIRRNGTRDVLTVNMRNLIRGKQSLLIGKDCVVCQGMVIEYFAFEREVMSSSYSESIPEFHN